MNCKGCTPEFDQYAATVEIFQQVDMLTWEYVASSHASGEKRAKWVREYGEGLKSAISAYIDTRTEMIAKLMLDPGFMNRSIPAASLPVTEANPADQALLLCSMLSKLSASESHQAQDAPSE